MSIFRIIKQLTLSSVFVLTTSYNIIAQDYLSKTDHNLPDLANAAMDLADVDHDGDLDLAIMGINNLVERKSLIYTNNGNGQFIQLAANIIQLSDGDLAWGDLNNDNYVDLIISGKDNSGNKKSAIYINNKDKSFTKSSYIPTGLAFGKILIDDFNNDGNNDFFINGIDESNQNQSIVYYNNSDGTFTESQNDITGLNKGDAISLDYNQDGYKDLILNGIDQDNSYITELYINSEEGFSRENINISGLAYGSISKGDFNSDGKPDLFLTGLKPNGNAYSSIYLMTENGYAEQLISFNNVYYSSSYIVDYNNDGNTDIFYIGRKNSTPVSYLYMNNGDMTFTLQAESFKGLEKGDLYICDLDGDKDLEQLSTGYTDTGIDLDLYTYSSALNIQSPTIPTNLSAKVEADKTILSWDKATDDISSSKSITYNVYVENTAGDKTIKTTNSKQFEGNLYYSGIGKYEHNQLIIENLEEGTYIFRVQAIDQQQAASAFSSSADFKFCKSVSIGNDLNVCTGTINQITCEAQNINSLKWFSKAQGQLSESTTKLKFETDVNDSIWVEVQKTVGCIIHDSIIITVKPIPELPDYQDSDLCFGDTLHLNAGTETEIVNWYKNKELVYSNQNNAEFIIKADQQIKYFIKAENNCISEDSINILMLELPDFDLPANINICENAIYTNNLSSFDKVNWSLIKKDQSYLNNPIIEFKIEQDERLAVEVFNENSCKTVDTMDIFSISAPVISAGNDTLICFNTSVVLGDKNNPDDVTYLWEPAGLLDFSDIRQPLASPNDKTMFKVKAVNTTGCESLDSVIVNVNTKPLIDAGDDNMICIGETFELGGKPTASNSLLSFRYAWADVNKLTEIISNESNPIIQPENDKKYRLLVYTYECIPDTDYISIKVNPLPNVSAGEDVSTGQGQAIALNANGAETYIWSPDIYLDNSELQNPIATINETTEFTVEGIDANGCKNTDKLTVFVKNEIFIPNLFTPNNDGNNDVFLVYGFGIVELSIKIIDINGNIVFESDNVDEITQQGWDGTIKGNPAPEGNYIWYLSGKYNDGQLIDKNNQKGIISILR